jgi:hypothetical protein
VSKGRCLRIEVLLSAGSFSDRRTNSLAEGPLLAQRSALRRRPELPREAVPSRRFPQSEFGLQPPDPDGCSLQRYLVHADLHEQEWMRECASVERFTFTLGGGRSPRSSVLARSRLPERQSITTSGR